MTQKCVSVLVGQLEGQAHVYVGRGRGGIGILALFTLWKQSLLKHMPQNTSGLGTGHSKLLKKILQKDINLKTAHCLLDSYL